MSKRDPLMLLEDILLSIQKIGRYTAKPPANCRKSTGAHTQIPWTQIAGLRNRIVHDYFGLDLEIIWQIIQHDLVELETQVKALLS